jgi:cytochrome c2
MKIPVPLQLVLLTVGLTAFYGMVGQSVPQKEVHPPEVIEIAEDVSVGEMVEIGKGIFEGKGICVTCHTIGKSGALRFPDLDDVSSRAAVRRPGYTALEYLAESLYEPDIFIVDGFSKGMPAINKPPIGLTDQEILAVIAFLQTLGGQATVDMQTKFVYTGGVGPGEGAPAEVDGAVLADSGDTGDVAELSVTPLGTYGCNQCHDAASPVDPSSPSLVGIGGRLNKDQLFLSLTNHPGNHGLDSVTLKELETLVQHLAEMGG